MVKVSSRPASASSYALVLPMPRLAHSGMKGRKSLCSFVLCIVRLWPHGLARGRNVFNGKLPGSCGIYRNGRGNYRLGDLPNLAQQCSQGLILRPVDAGKLHRLSYFCCPLAVTKLDVCLLAQRPNNAPSLVSFPVSNWLL